MAALALRVKLTPVQKELIIVLDTDELERVRSGLTVQGRRLLTAYLSHRSLRHWKEATKCRASLRWHGLDVEHPEKGVRRRRDMPLRGPQRPPTSKRGPPWYGGKGWLSKGTRQGRSNEGRVYRKRKLT